MAIDLTKIEGLSEEQIALITGAHDEDVTGLKSKNTELIGKVKTNSSVNDPELERLRQFEQSSLQKGAEDKSEYKEALVLATSKLNKEVDDGKSELDKANGTIRNLLVNNGLSDALDLVDVGKGFKSAVTALLSPQIEIVDGKAVVGDVALLDFVKLWATTDSGKAFIMARDNSGGGAPGSGGSIEGKKFSELGSDEKTSLFHSDRARYNQLKSAG